MKFKYRSIFWGVLLILIAVGMVCRSMGMIETSFTALLFGVIMLGILINSLIDVAFTGMLFSLAHLAVIFREQVKLPDTLSSWVVIIAATLAGVGLDIIFKTPRKKLQAMFSHSATTTYTSDDVIDVEGGTTFADANVHISNTFGEQTEYIRSNNFESGKIENSFGSLNVYLDQVALKNETAYLKVKNGFGKTVIHIPSSFRIELTKSNGFGNVQTMGQPSGDPAAPLIHIEAENGFGDLTIRCY